MSIDAMNRVAPRLLFVSALMGLGWISLNAPAWAEALKLEGYYTDFSLRLGLDSQRVVAGQATQLSFEVSSLGPDAAERPVLTLRDDVGLELIEVTPCARTSSTSLRCELPALQPGQSLPIGTLPVLTDPDARGVRLVSGFVSSENAPSAGGPGIKVDAAWLELVGEFDVGMGLLDQTPFPLPDGHLRWTFEIDNRGPSGVVDALLFVGSASNVSFRVSCYAYGGAVCAQPDGRIHLPVGSVLHINIDAPRGELDTQPLEVLSYISLREGTQIGGRPLSVELRYLPSLFSDGFEL